MRNGIRLIAETVVSTLSEDDFPDTRAAAVDVLTWLNQESTVAMFAQAEYVAERFDMSIQAVLKMAMYDEVERLRTGSFPMSEKWPDNWVRPEES